MGLPVWLLQRLWRLVLPGRADECLDCARISSSKRDPYADDLATPEELLGERWIHCEGLLALLLRDEHMNVLLLWWDGHEDLASHTERAELMVWFFRHFR